MEFHQRLMRRAIGTAAERAIGNAASDPRRAVRNLVDLGATFASGERQKAFFREAQALTSKYKSPWSALLGRAAREADCGSVKLIGINLGYTALACGSRMLEQTAEKWGAAVPWVVCLEPETAEFPELDALISDGNRTGIFTWAMRLQNSNCVRELAGLAARYPENTFWATLPPELAGARNSALLAAPKNIVAAVELRAESVFEPALAELAAQRMLFGFASEDERVFQSEPLLRLLCGKGCLFGVYTGIPPSDEPPVYAEQFFCGDAERNRPMLLINWEQDTRLVGGLAAKGSYSLRAKMSDLRAAGFSLERLVKEKSHKP